MSFILKSVAVATTILAMSGAFAQQGETVKIAWIDPLTGLMGPVGNNQLNTWKFMADEFNKKNPAGVKFEVIGLDNKLSPAESLTALKAALDQGARYIAQGNGSSVAGALIEAVDKHNQRNPGKEVIFLNYAAVDPDFTNSKCNYWHFRFDADTSMKMEAITTFMKDKTDIKKVYLLNQNYSHGQQVAKFAKENLSRKRPDVQIVGEDLHPLAQVRDFAPYIAKIKASGADTVITGNWGSDQALVALERFQCDRWVRKRSAMLNLSLVNRSVERQVHGVLHHLHAQWGQLRVAALYVELGSHPHFQHDGCAEFCARQLLHGGCLCRLHPDRSGGFLASLVSGAPDRGWAGGFV